MRSTSRILKIIAAFLTVCMLTCIGIGAASEEEPLDLLEAFDRYALKGENGARLSYRLYIPDDYDSEKAYPLLLFLHGAGERGSRNKEQMTVALPVIFDDPESPVREAIVLAPQCPEGKQWVDTPWEDGNYSVDEVPESAALEVVLEILALVRETYNVDSDRIYVTGLSMGGFGTWDLLARHSDIFAAGMPLCGGGDPSKADILREIPIRTFHGDEDGAVPVEGTREMYKSIILDGSAASDIKYEELKGMGHGIWDTVYENRENIDWLFSQNRAERSKEMADATLLEKMQKIFMERVYTAEDGYTLPYRLYIPENYDCGKTYPLVLFLHGAGERGTDNQQQITVGLPTMFEEPDSPVYGAVVVAPQCPNGVRWVDTPWENGNYSTAEIPESKPMQCVLGILEEVKAFANVDENRIYVTGLSMGGFGTWDLLGRHGDMFAAGMPICGGGDPSLAEDLRKIPIRTFHGSADSAVPVAGTRGMYDAITQSATDKAARISYREFDGAGHGIWDDVYRDRDNLNWLFSMNLAARMPKAAKPGWMKTAAVAGGLFSAVLVVAGIGLARKRKQK